MTTFAIKLAGVILLALGMSTGGNAQVIHWQVNGTLLDGAALAGRFDYEPVGGTFSNVSITTAPGNFLGATELMGWRYGAETNVLVEATDVVHFQQIIAGPPPLVLNFYELFLENFNPAVPVASNVGVFETILLAFNNPGKPSGVGQARPGQAVVQVIPEPEIVSLMLGGLGLMAGFSIRRKRKTKHAIKVLAR